jgi:hypothetical protein
LAAGSALIGTWWASLFEDFLLLGRQDLVQLGLGLLGEFLDLLALIFCQLHLLGRKGRDQVQPATGAVRVAVHARARGRPAAVGAITTPSGAAVVGRLCQQGAKAQHCQRRANKCQCPCFHCVLLVVFFNHRVRTHASSRRLGPALVGAGTRHCYE